MAQPAPSISPGPQTPRAIWRLIVSTGVRCKETWRPSASLPQGLRPRIGIRECNPDIRMLIPFRPLIKVAMKVSVPQRLRRLYPAGKRPKEIKQRSPMKYCRLQTKYGAQYDEVANRDD